jgi:hypothetical protein
LTSTAIRLIFASQKFNLTGDFSVIHEIIEELGKHDPALRNIHPDKANRLIRLLDKGPGYRLPTTEYANVNYAGGKIHEILTSGLNTHIKKVSKQHKKPLEAFEKWHQEFMSAACINFSGINFENIPRDDYAEELQILKKLQKHYIFSYVDKASSNSSICCKKYYLEKLQERLSDQTAFAKTDTMPRNVADQIKAVLPAPAPDAPFINTPNKLPYSHLILKMHKKGLRYITNSQNSASHEAAQIVATMLAAVLKYFKTTDKKCTLLGAKRANPVVTDTREVIDELTQFKELMAKKYPQGYTHNNAEYSPLHFLSIDFSALYDNIDLQDCFEKVSKMVDKFFDQGPSGYYKNHFLTIIPQKGKKPEAFLRKERHRCFHSWNKAELLEVLKVLMFTQVISNVGSSYRALKGLPQGSPLSPVVANLYLLSYELAYTQSSRYQDHPWPTLYLRFLDDVLGLGFGFNIFQEGTKIYPHYLKFTMETPELFKTEKAPSQEPFNKNLMHGLIKFLDLNIVVSHDLRVPAVYNGEVNYFLHDKRSEYKFKSNRFPRIDSLIHSKTLVGVIIGQALRFYRNSSHRQFFYPTVINYCAGVAEINGLEPVHEALTKFSLRHLPRPEHHSFYENVFPMLNIPVP